MRTILILLTSCLLFYTGHTAVIPADAVLTTPVKPVIKQNKLPLPKISDIEKMIGHKLNFVERAACKIMIKKMERRIKKGKYIEMDADKLARQSELMGLLALGSLILFPLLTIPFGILAITKGARALAGGTTMPEKARTGRTLGIVCLSLLVVLVFLIVLFIAMLTHW
jgi:hypothetical protein